MSKLEGLDGPYPNQEKNDAFLPKAPLPLDDSIPETFSQEGIKDLGRRRFIQLAAFSLSSAILAACGLPAQADQDQKIFLPAVGKGTPDLEPQSADTSESPAEDQTPASKAETEQPAECSFFKDPKFCGLAEVYKATNPRTGEFKSVGIRAPSDSEAVIEVISPIDGWFHPILDNPLRGNISTDKNRLVDGWVIRGVEFKPTGRADATPIKKGAVIGVLKDTGYRPLSYAPDYIAYFSPRAADEEAHIAKYFPTAAAKPPRQLEFQSSGTTIEQGPVIETK